MVLPDDVRDAALKRGALGLTVIEAWFATGDVDEADSLGLTLLYHAAAVGLCDHIRLLLGYGASVNRACFERTPLHVAASNGYDDAVSLLLDAGAGIDAAAFQGRTPLFDAALFDNHSTARLLLRRGAKYDAVDGQGRTAEALAREFVSRHQKRPNTVAFLAGVRDAGGWKGYLRVPRKRLLSLRLLCEQGRAAAQDALLRRLFPAPPPPGSDDVERAPESHRAGSDTDLPREIFWLITEFWRSDRAVIL